VRAERIWIALAGLALLCCAPHSNFVPVATEVRADMRLSRPLGKCLSRALKLGDSEDLGRGSTQGTRYMGSLEPITGATLQRQQVRFFTPESNDALFFDAIAAERRCADGTFYFLVHAEDYKAATSEVVLRLDALVARVRSSCRVTPLAEEPAHVVAVSSSTCSE
jgi:hypothetical protein